MNGCERARGAARDIGIGAGTVGIATVLTLWGTLATLQISTVLLVIGLLVWAAVVNVDRLRRASGWPKPLVFSALAGGVAASGAAFSFTGLAPLLLICLLVGAAFIVALVRVLRRLGTGS